MSGQLSASSAPPGAGAPPSRIASLVLALLSSCSALVITISPVLPWATTVFDTSASGLSWFDGDDEVDWVLGSIPNGVPTFFLGLALLVAAGGAASLSLLNRKPASRWVLAGLHGAVVALSGLAFIWYVVSYEHFRSLGGGLIEMGPGIAFGFLAAIGAGGIAALAVLLLFTMRDSSARATVAPGYGAPYGASQYPAVAEESTHG